MKGTRLVLLSIGVTATLLSLSLNGVIVASDKEAEEWGIGGDEPEAKDPKKKSRLSGLKSKAGKAVTETSKAVSNEIGKSSVIKSGKEFAKSAGETIDTGIEFGAKAATIAPRAGIRAGRSIAKRVAGKDKDKEQMEREESPVVEESSVETAEKGRLSRLKESAVGKAVSKEIGKSSVLKSGKEFAKSVGDTVDTGIEFGAKAATIVPRAGIRAGESVAKRVTRRSSKKDMEKAAHQEQELDRFVAARRKEEERAENERVEKLGKDPENQRFFAKIREQEYARMDKEDRLAEEKQRKLEEAKQQAIEVEKAKMIAEREERRRAREEAKVAREEAKARRHEEKAAKYQEKRIMLQHEQEKRKLAEEGQAGQPKVKTPSWMVERPKPSVNSSTSKGAAESPLTTLEDMEAKKAKRSAEREERNRAREETRARRHEESAAIRQYEQEKRKREEELHQDEEGERQREPSLRMSKSKGAAATEEHTEPQDVHPSEENVEQPKLVKSRETGELIDAKQKVAKLGVVGQIKGLGKNTQGILTPMEMGLEKERLRNESAKMAQAEKQEVKENAPPSAEEMAVLREGAIDRVIRQNIKQTAKRNKALDLLRANEPEDKVIEFLSQSTSKTQEEIKQEIEEKVQQQIKFREDPFGSNVQP
jgi:trichohyalin